MTTSTSFPGPLTNVDVHNPPTFVTINKTDVQKRHVHLAMYQAMARDDSLWHILSHVLTSVIVTMGAGRFTTNLNSTGHLKMVAVLDRMLLQSRYY